jgi:hypothetical protein
MWSSAQVSVLPDQITLILMWYNIHNIHSTDGRIYILKVLYVHAHIWTQKSTQQNLYLSLSNVFLFSSIFYFFQNFQQWTYISYREKKYG